MSTRYFGAHVSASGGLENALAHAQTLGVNTIQIHPSPPQRWNSKPFAPGIEQHFVAALPKSGVKKVFFHGIYLINLANPDPQQQQLSRLSLAHDLDLCARICADGVIFHCGSLKDEPDETLCFRRVAEGIDWALTESPANSRILMEVAAGGGNVIGDRMEELATIYSFINNKARVGFALDTQHLWASGYDLINDLDNIIAQVERNFGFDLIGAIHLNDSKTELGSRKDRHENLGQGLIGKVALEKFVNHPKLRHIPFILETPALKAMETAPAEVQALRAIIK